MSSYAPDRAAARAELIRHTPLQGDDDGVDLRRLIPAWIISGALHVVLLSLLLLFTFADTVHGVGGEQGYRGEVETEPKDDDKRYDVEEVGDGSGRDINFNVERLAEQSLPGPINPNEALGLPGGQLNLPAASISGPPGLGNDSRIGGPADSTKIGKSSMFTGPGIGARHVPGGVDGRSGATRVKLLEEGGGNTRSEAAVAAGLKWIIRHQALDGHWGMHDFHAHGKCNCSGAGGNHDVAGTAFGLLPLLGVGETHNGTGKNHLYSKNVERGLKWLITRQGADGAFSGNGYEHAIAAIAICEAYSVTADPVLKGPAQRAVNACVAWQHADGGFRYSPRTPGDLSVSGWFVQALKSGYLAGLQVPNGTWNGINAYLDSVSNPEGSMYGYTEAKPAPTVTAVGLLSRQYMGWGPRSVGLLKGSEYLSKLPPSANFRNIYYYYYATQVMYHQGAVNPEGWQQWNEKMRDLLIDTQDQGLNADRRDQKGSWSAEGDAWGGQLGRLGYTSLCLLTLEVYYRHLPLYRRELGAMKDPAMQRN